MTSHRRLRLAHLHACDTVYTYQFFSSRPCLMYSMVFFFCVGSRYFCFFTNCSRSRSLSHDRIRCRSDGLVEFASQKTCTPCSPGETPRRSADFPHDGSETRARTEGASHRPSVGEGRWSKIVRYHRVPVQTEMAEIQMRFPIY